MKKLEAAQANLADTTGELEKATELAKKRLDVAKRIQDDFKDHGIAADVDSGTGDVILDFGRDYFETDSHDLKPGMERTIRKAIPVYAKSLFDDQNVAANISAVEIIGFRITNLRWRTGGSARSLARQPGCIELQPRSQL